MKLTIQQLKKLHQRSSLHSADLAVQKVASCFHCTKVFMKDRIGAMTDCGLTAICPHCHVDAVLPGHYEKPILRQMREYWFRRPTEDSR